MTKKLRPVTDFWGGSGLRVTAGQPRSFLVPIMPNHLKALTINMLKTQILGVQLVVTLLGNIIAG